MIKVWLWIWVTSYIDLMFIEVNLSFLWESESQRENNVSKHDRRFEITFKHISICREFSQLQNCCPIEIFELSRFDCIISPIILNTRRRVTREGAQSGWKTSHRLSTSINLPWGIPYHERRTFTSKISGRTRWTGFQTFFSPIRK